MKRILVIDDDELILKSIAFSLNDDNCTIVTAKDAYSALEIANKSKVDVIICDIMMPALSGLELLSLLKNFYLNSIPVIIMSSLVKEDVVSSALNMGASYFVSKPLDYDSLKEKVQELSTQKAY